MFRPFAALAAEIRVTEGDISYAMRLGLWAMAFGGGL